MSKGFFMTIFEGYVKKTILYKGTRKFVNRVFRREDYCHFINVFVARKLKLVIKKNYQTNQLKWT